MTFSLEALLIPNNLIDGGVVGISMMLSKMSGLSLGLFLVVINLPFIWMGYKQIGKRFALSTLYGIIILSILTLKLHDYVEPFTQDPLLATIFGGAMLGLGVGLVIKVGGALDGTEVLAVVLIRNLPFSVGEVILFINIVIFSVAGFVFTPENAAYSLLAYIVAFKTIDFVQVGLSESKSVHIISNHYEEIGKSISLRLGRGVTYLNGSGAFGDAKQIVWCVITRLEESKLKEIVDDIDPKAFVTIAEIAEVRGGRFNKKNIH